MTTALLTQGAILSCLDKKGGEVFGRMLADLGGDVGKMAGPSEQADPHKPPVRSEKKDSRVPKRKSKHRQPVPPRPTDQLLK